jgi:choline dehydrogenase
VEAGEVILCGGAVNSPQLLLLSGIGPTQDLIQAGITPVHHLPGVGKNLLDHIDVITACYEKTKFSYSSSLSWENVKRGVRDVYEYGTNSSGPLSSNVGEAGGFIKSSPDISRPDIQLHFGPILFEDHGKQLVFDYGYSLHACVLRPKSSGMIGVSSAHPILSPIINPNYLSAPEDVSTLLHALKKCRQVRHLLRV